MKMKMIKDDPRRWLIYINIATETITDDDDDDDDDDGLFWSLFGYVLLLLLRKIYA